MSVTLGYLRGVQRPELLPRVAGGGGGRPAKPKLPSPGGRFLRRGGGLRPELRVPGLAGDIELGPGRARELGEALAGGAVAREPLPEPVREELIGATIGQPRLEEYQFERDLPEYVPDPKLQDMVRRGQVSFEDALRLQQQQAEAAARGEAARVAGGLAQERETRAARGAELREEAAGRAAGAEERAVAGEKRSLEEARLKREREEEIIRLRDTAARGGRFATAARQRLEALGAPTEETVEERLARQGREQRQRLRVGREEAEPIPPLEERATEARRISEARARGAAAGRPPTPPRLTTAARGRVENMLSKAVGAKYVKKRTFGEFKDRLKGDPPLQSTLARIAANEKLSLPELMRVLEGQFLSEYE